MRAKKPMAEGGVELAKVVTPMLDLSFNILFFFVVMYHPSAMEGHIDGKLLPPEDAVGKGESKEPMELPPLQEDPVVEDHFKVLLRAVKAGQTEGDRQDGDPSQLFLQRPETPDLGVPLADNDVKFADALERLKTELKQILEGPTGKASKVKLLADGNLKYSYLMQVYDVCRLAEVVNKNGEKVKFKDVSFVGPAPLP